MAPRSTATKPEPKPDDPATDDNKTGDSGGETLDRDGVRTIVREEVGTAIKEALADLTSGDLTGKGDGKKEDPEEGMAAKMEAAVHKVMGETKNVTPEKPAGEPEKKEAEEPPAPPVPFLRKFFFGDGDDK